MQKKSNGVIVTNTNDAENLHFNLRDLQNLDTKILQSHFPAKFIPKSTTKNGSCRNSAFQLRNLEAKILHNHISAKFIKKSTTNR